MVDGVKRKGLQGGLSWRRGESLTCLFIRLFGLFAVICS